MKFIIHRKVLIFMLFTGLSMLGVISYHHLPMELFPGTQAPTLIVQVGSQLSQSPKYIEQQAVIPLEGVIGQLDGVKGIESMASQQFGRIQVSYQNSTNMKFAYLKLVEKIEEKAKTLPEGFSVEVSKVDTEAINNLFMTLQVRGSGGVDRVRKIVDAAIIERLQRIEGVAIAEAFGGRQHAVQVVLNEEACKAHGLSPSDVQEAINRNNQPAEYAGTVHHHNQRHSVTVFSAYTDLEEIKELIIKENEPLKLKHIAEISFGVKEQSSYSRVNGKETVTIRLIKDAESNLINVADAVTKQLDIINQELAPADIEVVVETNTAEIMEDNIDLIINLAITGGILAIFVLWFFLKNIRLVATVALAIPVSIFAAFNFFYAFDISINSITLLGIALAVGMLLDNSIVVMENIYRLAAKEGDIDKATIQGTKEVWRSIFAATLTTMVVFLPFIFSENPIVGILGKNIGVSVVATLLISLAVSLLLIPMLTHFLLKRKKSGHLPYFQRISIHNRLVQIYQVFLKSCMRRPARTILGALLLFFVVLILSVALGSMYQEEAQVKELTLYVNMEQGATLEKTDKVVTEVEERLRDFKEQEELLSQIYEEEATIKISLAENYRQVRNFSLPEIKESIMHQLQDLEMADFTWEPAFNGKRFQGGGEGPASGDGFGSLLGNLSGGEKVLIKGQDFEKIYRMAQELKYHLEQQAGMESVNVGVPSNSPELHLNFDQYLMSVYDISPQAVVRELRSFPGEIASGATLKQGHEEHPILIKIKDKEAGGKVAERNLEDLKQLTITNGASTTFEIAKIAGFTFAEGLTTINRVDQARQVAVHYAFAPTVMKEKDLLAAAQQSVDRVVGSINLPAGIAVEVIHDDRDFSDFPFLIFAAFLLIYMILASVFESFATPVVLMFTIPLAATGSLLALLLTASPLLNFVTLIGFMILLGIVVNNSIILIDYTRVLKRRGVRSQRALMFAGLARLRPIMVTAITTIVALLPMAMGRGEYISLSGVPFAITVIGGLVVSTLLTLIFIPTFHSGLTESLQWIYSRSPVIKVVMLALSIAGFYYIYTEEESLIWQIIEGILLIVLVPGTIAFIQNSLRKASEKVIDPREPIVIKIRNLVKIYDRESRFMRDWQSGINIRKRLGLEGEIRSWKDFDSFLWQIPLKGFFFYFTYGFIQSGFWEFTLPILLYMGCLQLLDPVKAYFAGTENKWAKRTAFFLYKSFFWGFPFLALNLYNAKYDLTGFVIPVGIIWYFLLIVKVTSDKLHKEKVNINRIKGPFKGFRKMFFRFVLVIPLVGRKKTPFKALKGVSLEIKNGMFGLLGPNGAGKSTLIRIICGLLEPSYGEITINGLDIKEKREELQGLIGYLPQEFGTYENLSAWDFLDYLAILKKLSNKKERHERIEYVLKAVHMFDQRHEKIGSFSGGMRQRIGIAQILLHLPRILVVDEPTAGLDPRERIRFRNLLVELSKERVVIFSTHIIEDVASSCNKLAVVKEGEVKYVGAPVHMAETANGKVWVAEMSLAEFDTFKESYVIIHHIRQGEAIKVRCLAESIPFKNAHLVNASLEDAYLYLLNQLKVNQPVKSAPEFESNQSEQPLAIS